MCVCVCVGGGGVVRSLEFVPDPNYDRTLKALRVARVQVLGQWMADLSLTRSEIHPAEHTGCSVTEFSKTWCQKN